MLCAGSTSVLVGELALVVVVGCRLDVGVLG